MVNTRSSAALPVVAAAISRVTGGQLATNE
jgi:hypothetical protein